MQSTVCSNGCRCSTIACTLQPARIPEGCHPCYMTGCTSKESESPPRKLLSVRQSCSAIMLHDRKKSLSALAETLPLPDLEVEDVFVFHEPHLRNPLLASLGPLTGKLGTAQNAHRRQRPAGRGGECPRIRRAPRPYRRKASASTAHIEKACEDSSSFCCIDTTFDCFALMARTPTRASRRRIRETWTACERRQTSELA